MKYKIHKIDKLSFLEVDNEKGLNVVFSPVGAGIRTITFDGMLMNVAPKEIKDFLSQNNKLGKTLGPILDSKTKFIINNKEYILNDDNIKYNCSNFIYTPNPHMDNNIFSIIYIFKKKKKKDGLPANITYYVSYSMSGSSNDLLVDYRVLNDEDTPIKMTNNLLFNLGSYNFNELYLTLPSGKVLKDSDFVDVSDGYDFRKKRNIFSNMQKDKHLKEAGYDCYFQLGKNEEPIILENSKYKLEIISSDYKYVKIDSDNEMSEVLSLNNGNAKNRGLLISLQDNPLDDNIVAKKENYYRQFLYRFIKK